MKPKWQRGRVLSNFATSPNQFEGRGALLWVEIGIPTPIDSMGAVYTREISDGPCFQTNVLSPVDQREPNMKRLNLAVDANQLELLARDENDFAGDVRLVPWEEFLAQCRAAKGVKVS